MPPLTTGRHDPYRADPFTPNALGFLCLIPVGLTVILQALQLGVHHLVGTAIPVSDSNLWAGCASSIAQFNSPQNLGWCLKRPLTMFLQAPEFFLAPHSMNAVIVLQILGISTLLWWFLLVLGRTLPVSRVAVAILLAIATWPVIYFGTHLGPEGPALALTFVSATAALKFLFTQRVVWGFVGGAAALLVLQIRPGNPLLTVTIMITVVVVLWRAANSRLAAIAVAMSYLLVWWLPLQILKSLGWSDAGHGSNFWFVVYSAATPEQDTWMTAYEVYAAQVGCPPEWSPDPCLGLDTTAFTLLIRDATVGLIQQYPMAIPKQILINLESILQAGYLGNLMAWPYSPAWTLARMEEFPEWWQVGGHLVSSLLAAASLVLLPLLVAGLVLLNRSATKARMSFDALPTAGQRTMSGSIWLGVATVVGLVGFLALVIHDEGSRHMVQNIPFILITVAAVWSGIIFPGKWGSVTQSTSRPAKWRRGIMPVLILAIFGAAVVEGHREGTAFTVAGRCGSAIPKPEDFTVVSAVSWGGGIPFTTPANWRILTNRDSRMWPNDGWVGGVELATLPAGTLVDLRSDDDGNLMPAFVKAGDFPAPDKTTWCLRSPSQYGTMLVYDLVPLGSQ